MFRIARNHSKKYHLCQKPDRSASARIWIFVLTSPSSGLFWKLWLSPLSLCNLESGPNSAIASLCPEPNHLTLTASLFRSNWFLCSALFLWSNTWQFWHTLWQPSPWHFARVPQSNVNVICNFGNCITCVCICVCICTCTATDYAAQICYVALAKIKFQLYHSMYLEQ